MARTYLDFERPIAELDSQIEAALADGNDISSLEEKAKTELEALYSKIGPWEKTHVARHPARPHYTTYVDALVSDYTPCLLYTSPSPRDKRQSRMPSSA